MKKKWIVCGLMIILLIVGIFILPFPQRIQKVYEGIALQLGAEGEAIPVQVELDGTMKRYLIKENLYTGKLSIPLLAYSTDPSCFAQVSFTKDTKGILPIGFVFYQDDHTLYSSPGYIVPIDGLNRFYFRIKGDDGHAYEVLVPASNREEADTIRVEAEACLAPYPLPD